MSSSKIYLCKADRSVIGTITGIKPETCSLTKNAADLWEITFDVDRYIEADGCLVQSDYYDSIDDMMKLYLDSEPAQVFFVIDSEPAVKGEGLQETKTVSAHSIECELSHMYLQNLKVNCGTADSQEFLLTDKAGNLVNNINAYNPKTMRWVDLINYEEPQLSILHLALQNTGWTVKENIPNDICALRGSFESSDSVYSFLMKTVSPALSVLFEFDRKNKQIGVVKAADYGKDTGVFVTMRNLMNSFEITSSSEDSIMTKLVPSGADNLGIEQVNFGKDYILNLDYFMNTLNEYGDYKYVSAKLHDKYCTWKNYRDGELVHYTFENRETKEFEGTRRDLYRELTKEYNGIYSAVSELKNRVPNDGCFVDYGTFSLEELEASLTAYNNALAALLTLYKNDIIEKYRLPFDSDYPDDPEKSTRITIHDDYSLTITPEPSEPISPALLPDTDYWYDYYAYREVIIPKVEEAIKAFENPDYTPQNIDAYLYQWELYGLDELEAKKKAWKECADILYKECFIKSKKENQIVYRTADDNGWNEIAGSQSEFTSKEAFFHQLNQYLDYVYNRNDEAERYNSLTKAAGDGILVQCEKAVREKKEQIRLLEAAYETYNTARNQLADSADLKLFEVNDEPLFTAEELNIISSMLRTKDYSNEYILTTSLDTVVTAVDVQEELYQAAQKELEQLSQPQYSFRTELDNLYALEEFKSYREPFDVGNFIRVGPEIHEELYDNDYIKLRLISITHNPLENTDNLSVTFSTMTKSLNTISDLAFLLDSQNVSSGGRTSSSSSGGTYGDNDADVQMSNTMLNALLKTELFGTAVNDVILDSLKANKGNFHTLFSHSGAFDSLEAGQVKISGDCLFDRIKSRNWNGTDTDLLGNSQGSVIDLSNGKFNFAGGKLKWDGTTLTIEGNGKFSGDISGSNGTFNGTLNGCNGSFTGSLNVNNKFIVDAKGNVVAEGTLKATNANISGTIHATNSIITESTLTGSDIEANNLTASKGTIAGWNFNDSAFYKNSASIGYPTGKYWGDNGLSVGDYFVVKNTGIFQKNADFSNEQYSTSMNVSLPLIISDEDTSYNINNGYIILSFVNVPPNTPFGFKFRTRIYVHYTDSSGSEIYTTILKEKSWNWNTNALVSKDNVEIVENNYNDIDNSNVIKMKIKCDSLKLYGDGYIDGYPYTIDSRDIYAFYNGTYGTPLQIKELEAYDANEQLIYTCNGTKTHRKKGFLINSFSNEIMTNNITLSDDALSLYDNCEFLIKGTSETDSYTEDEIVKITKEMLKHTGLSATSSGTNLTILDGCFYKKSSSSKRYKNSITPLLEKSETCSKLSSQHLYDIDVVTFKYNDDYLSETDQRYRQDIPGFLAEDVYEKYPIACNLDADGNPEMWDINIMFPAALALIQEQHKDIESLKKEIEKLKISKEQTL